MDVRPKTIFEMMKRGYGKFPLYHSPINPSGDQEGSYQHTHSLSTRLKLSQKSVLLLPRPDSVTYGIIIGYHLTNSQPKDALKLLEEMEANGLIPHRKTVGLIISYLVDNSHLHLAIKLWLSYCHLITNLRRDTLEEPQLRQTTSVSGGRSSGVVDFKQYSRTLLSLYAMPKLISGCLSSKSTLVFGGDTCVFITDQEIHQPISKLISANMETNETSDPHFTLNDPGINSCGKEVLFASFYSKFQNWKSAIKIFLYSQENYPKLFATRNGETCTKVLNSLMSFYFNLHIDCVDKLYLDNSNDFDSDSRAALLREFECSKSIDLILSCYKNGSNPNSDTYSIIMKYVTFLARKLNSPHSSNSLAIGVNLLDKISQSLLNSCNPTTPTKPTLPSYYISQDSNYINIAPRINIHSVLYHPPDISILADDPKCQLGYLPATTTLDSHQPGATTVRQLSEFSGILLAHMLNSRLVPDINTLVLFIPAILASNSNFGTAISLWHLTTELNPKLSKKLSHGGFESTNPDTNGTSASERGNSKASKSNSALVSFKLSLLQKSSSWSSRSNVRSWLDYVGINNS
ncbi:hypothetical protein AX774_g1229 [Zancudomyces culisetae]|uniref:Pentatricopeptide repeat-containing protein n=1 Tax=Zancudomyces culisetae TaxID=1213189 RepID=A0A1R1PW66_ZANCU|nr:hypothetical protein AX774_g4079 [Zancudomyces culisetae]OMH85225.1 hypothetical protein AX774_g1229 [Zancudomyces culisetae]|eukprot:OMH82439.1 hypothetical protein AX774_g4079 [Zancudomyces culisetae]